MVTPICFSISNMFLSVLNDLFSEGILLILVKLAIVFVLFCFFVPVICLFMYAIWFTFIISKSDHSTVTLRDDFYADIFHFRSPPEDVLHQHIQELVLHVLDVFDYS